jgi:hypothetical protein
MVVENQAYFKQAWLELSHCGDETREGVAQNEAGQECFTVQQHRVKRCK